MNKTPLKNKLAWQCRRGMLELDVILIPFLEQHFDGLSDEQQQLFSLLLEEADPDLYTWLMGFGECENERLRVMVSMIRDKMNIHS